MAEDTQSIGPDDVGKLEDVLGPNDPLVKPAPKCHICGGSYPCKATHEMAYWICDCGKHVPAPQKKCECGVEWDDSRARYPSSDVDRPWLGGKRGTDTKPPEAAADDARCVKCGHKKAEHTVGLCPTTDTKGTCGRCAKTGRPLKPYEHRAGESYQLCDDCRLEMQNYQRRRALNLPDGILKCPQCGGALDDENKCVTPDCSGITPKHIEDQFDSQAHVNSTVILQHLYKAGVIDGMDERVIIDLTINQPARIYTQRFASEAFLSVFMGKPVLMALLKGETIEAESGDESCQNTDKATA